MTDETQTKQQELAATAPGDDPASAFEAGRDKLPPAEQLDENLDEANPDDVILAHPEWGSVAMAAMAGSFDMVVPAAMLAANYTLFRNADLRGEGSLTDGTMTLEATFQNMFQGLDENGKPKEDEDSLLDDFADMARDERAERKREREEWQQTEHEYAGVTMTGEEWGALAKDLSKGGKLRQWLIAKIKKNENATDSEAASLADKVALRTEMNHLPPDQWTDGMKQLNKDMQTDPELKGKVDGYVQESAQQRSASYGLKNSIDKTAVDRDRDVSVATRSDILNVDAPVVQGHITLASASIQPSSPPDPKLGDGTAVSMAHEDFPTAPDLTAHHQAAVAAVEPLDAPKPPTRIASAPAPSNAAGLDV